jgi:hypothetical protein
MRSEIHAESDKQFAPATSDEIRFIPYHPLASINIGPMRHAATGETGFAVRSRAAHLD